MTIEAQHAVTLRHHNVQIMTDQQDANLALCTKPRNECVKFRFTNIINTPHRFIEHHQLWRPHQCSRNQHAL